MIKVAREAGTDYLFAGLLEKELQKHDFPIDVDIFIEPRGKGEIYFSQDGTCEENDGVKFCFYVEPSEREKMVKLFGNNCALVTYAADPEVHRDFGYEKVYDVGFVGKPGGDERDLYLKTLEDSGLKFYFADDLGGEAVGHALSKCKVLFNYIRYVDVNLRFFESMAIGCQLVNRKWGLDNFAQEDIHYVGYSTPHEMLLKLHELLDNKNERLRIQTNARSHFLANHTYAHRAVAIINHLKEKYVHSS